MAKADHLRASCSFWRRPNLHLFTCSCFLVFLLLAWRPSFINRGSHRSCSFTVTVFGFLQGDRWCGLLPIVVVLLFLEHHLQFPSLFFDSKLKISLNLQIKATTLTAVVISGISTYSSVDGKPKKDYITSSCSWSFFCTSICKRNASVISILLKNTETQKCCIILIFFS